LAPISFLFHFPLFAKTDRIADQAISPIPFISLHPKFFEVIAGCVTGMVARQKIKELAGYAAWPKWSLSF
jgi:hypothetical protein